VDPEIWGNASVEPGREDAVDDLLLSEVVWRSVRGPNSPMPAPVRAAFVFGQREDKDGGLRRRRFRRFGHPRGVPEFCEPGGVDGELGATIRACRFA
jgi:hypothetical protein